MTFPRDEVNWSVESPAEASRLAPCTLIALLLLLAAAFVHWGLAPVRNALPAEYAAVTHYVVQSRLRTSASEAFTEHNMVAQRVDQTIVHAGGASMVQGDLHWYTESGQMVFENSGLYGVDRHNRANVPGYGDVQRTGQYLFPPGVQKTTYVFWDPMFMGPREAVFDHEETVQGMDVLVFRFSATGLDETAGYSHLPDVPERYNISTDGQGTLWIEPDTGVVVDYEEAGVSSFVHPKTGARVASLFEWRDRYTPETHAAQMALAADARWRALTLGVWLPAGMTLAGTATLGFGLWHCGRARSRRSGRADAAQAR